MNKVIIMGRLTREPDVRYTEGKKAIARYTLAVDRRFKRDGDTQTADFISCVAFGKRAEIAEKYFHQGTKILVTGRIQTGSYTNKDGQRVHTTDIVVDDQEFAESRNNSKPKDNGSSEFMNVPDGFESNQSSASQPTGFMNIPDGIDEELPFN